MRRMFAAGVLLVICTLFMPSHFAAAQTAADVPKTTIEDIRTSVLQLLGAPDKAVEVSVARNAITVLRINSDLNHAGHDARDGEASRIAPIVAKALADKAEFKRFHTIRVEYVSRTDTGTYSKVVDTIYFRRAPTGTFLLHTT
jgi:hypothetical protein